MPSPPLGTTRRAPRRGRATFPPTPLRAIAAFLILACSSLAPSTAFRKTAGAKSRTLIPGNHTRNAAVLVSSSRYWHNYRHVSNVLLMYRLLKSGGMRDEDIILMVADDLPCDARNPHRGAIFPDRADGGSGRNLYGPDAEIDYRGLDVSVDHFVRVLTGRHLPGEAPGRRLRLTPGTNVLVYLTGHGGDQFFKFQDGEEVTAQDLHSTFVQMKASGRYNELLFVADTCQAFTLDPTADGVGGDGPPDVMTIASSLKDQNSYAHHADAEIGQSIVDRYTYYVSEFLRGGGGGDGTERERWERLSVREALVDSLRDKPLGADVGLSDGSFRRGVGEVSLCDFLCARGGAAKAEAIPGGCDFGPAPAGMGEGEDAARRRRAVAMASVAEERAGPLSHGQTGPNVGDSKESAKGGMRPSDPRFLLSVVGLLVAVRLSSNRW